jgi:DNA invertase Pin-like site-specific DNA recombinase
MPPFLIIRIFAVLSPTGDRSETTPRGNRMKMVGYYRVSTPKQGRSGLGLQAQKAAVKAFINGGKLIGEFTEIETGKNNNRPKLAEAIQACRIYGATLVIAKLDRLSRNAHFLLGLKEAGVEFVCCDMPNANRLTVGIMAMVAEEERRMISERTKAALTAAKARGIKIGGDRDTIPTKEARRRAAESVQRRVLSKARDLAPIIKNLQASGAESLRAIADGLNRMDVPTVSGKGMWNAELVRRVLNRL